MLHLFTSNGRKTRPLQMCRLCYTKHDVLLDAANVISKMALLNEWSRTPLHMRSMPQTSCLRITHK